MIVLFDTDILIDVALDRMPYSDDSAKALDVAEQQLISAFVAWHSISNFY